MVRLRLGTRSENERNGHPGRRAALPAGGRLVHLEHARLTLPAPVRDVNPNAPGPKLPPCVWPDASSPPAFVFKSQFSVPSNVLEQPRTLSGRSRLITGLGRVHDDETLLRRRNPAQSGSP